MALLDALGFSRGVCVQGNAHGFDNRAILDATRHHPERLRAVGITDLRIEPDTLREWHAKGMRGLRFHFCHPDHRPAYMRGVGLGVYEVLRPVMRDLGWHIQVWCDWRQLPELAPIFRQIGREMRSSSTTC